MDKNHGAIPKVPTKTNKKSSGTASSTTDDGSGPDRKLSADNIPDRISTGAIPKVPTKTNKKSSGTASSTTADGSSPARKLSADNIPDRISTGAIPKVPTKTNKKSSGTASSTTDDGSSPARKLSADNIPDRISTGAIPKIPTKTNKKSSGTASSTTDDASSPARKLSADNIPDRISTGAIPKIPTKTNKKSSGTASSTTDDASSPARKLSADNIPDRISTGAIPKIPTKKNKKSSGTASSTTDDGSSPARKLSADNIPDRISTGTVPTSTESSWASCTTRDYTPCKSSSSARELSADDILDQTSTGTVPTVPTSTEFSWASCTSRDYTPGKSSSSARELSADDILDQTSTGTVPTVPTSTELSWASCTSRDYTRGKSRSSARELSADDILDQTSTGTVPTSTEPSWASCTTRDYTPGKSSSSARELSADDILDQTSTGTVPTVPTSTEFSWASCTSRDYTRGKSRSSARELSADDILDQTSTGTVPTVPTSTEPSWASCTTRDFTPGKSSSSARELSADDILDQTSTGTVPTVPTSTEFSWASCTSRDYTRGKSRSSARELSADDILDQTSTGTVPTVPTSTESSWAMTSTQDDGYAKSSSSDRELSSNDILDQTSTGTVPTVPTSTESSWAMTSTQDDGYAKSSSSDRELSSNDILDQTSTGTVPIFSTSTESSWTSSTHGKSSSPTRELSADDIFDQTSTGAVPTVPKSTEPSGPSASTRYDGHGKAISPADKLNADNIFDWRSTISPPPIIRGKDDTPVTITKGLKSAIVAIDSPITLNCIVDGVPEPVGIWSKNGITLQCSDNIKISAQGREHKLQIKNAELGDAGTYRFDVYNYFNKKHTVAQLFVTSLQSLSEVGAVYGVVKNYNKVNQHLINQHVWRGGKVMLQMKLEEEATDIEWYKGIQTLPCGSEVMKIEVWDKMTRLHIYKPETTGLYTAIAITGDHLCSSSATVVVQSRMNKDSIKSANITPKDDKSVTIQNCLRSQIVVGARDTIRLHCQVTINCRIQITWLKDDVPLIQGPRIFVEDLGQNTLRLKINDAIKSDSGCYALRVRNEKTKRVVETNCMVKVVDYIMPVEPVKVLKNLEPVVAIEQSSVAFSCAFNIENHDRTFITWYVGHFEINRSSGSYDVSSKNGEATLYINKICPELAGEVTCELRQVRPLRQSILLTKLSAHLYLVPTPVLNDLIMYRGEGENPRVYKEIRRNYSKLVWLSPFSDYPHPLTKTFDYQLDDDVPFIDVDINKSPEDGPLFQLSIVRRNTIHHLDITLLSKNAVKVAVQLCYQLTAKKDEEIAMIAWTVMDTHKCYQNSWFAVDIIEGGTLATDNITSSSMFEILNPVDEHKMTFVIKAVKPRQDEPTPYLPVRFKISENTRDFMDRLMVIAPGGRMTASQVLDHAWLKLGRAGNTGLTVGLPYLEPYLLIRKVKTPLISLLSRVVARFNTQEVVTTVGELQVPSLIYSSCV